MFTENNANARKILRNLIGTDEIPMPESVQIEAMSMALDGINL